MIQISEYKMFLADMIAAINKEIAGEGLSTNVVLSPSESSFTKKMAEQEGIVLGGSYPTLESENSTSDDLNAHHPCVLFILKKIDLSMLSDSEIDEFYDHIGDIMQRVMFYLSGGNVDLCTSRGWQLDGGFHLEWEYNYTAFYGASISFNIV